MGKEIRSRGAKSLRFTMMMLSCRGLNVNYLYRLLLLLVSVYYLADLTHKSPPQIKPQSARAAVSCLIDITADTKCIASCVPPASFHSNSNQSLHSSTKTVFVKMNLNFTSCALGAIKRRIKTAFVLYLVEVGAFVPSHFDF